MDVELKHNNKFQLGRQNEKPFLLPPICRTRTNSCCLFLKYFYGQIGNLIFVLYFILKACE